MHPEKGATANIFAVITDLYISFAMLFMVAVGMPVTQHPPHRSRRALLTHRAPTSGSDVHAQVRVWMTNAGPWEPAVNESVHSFPVEAMALATTKQRLLPYTTQMKIK